MNNIDILGHYSMRVGYLTSMANKNPNDRFSEGEIELANELKDKLSLGFCRRLYVIIFSFDDQRVARKVAEVVKICLAQSSFSAPSVHRKPLDPSRVIAICAPSSLNNEKAVGERGEVFEVDLEAERAKAVAMAVQQLGKPQFVITSRQGTKLGDALSFDEATGKIMTWLRNGRLSLDETIYVNGQPYNQEALNQLFGSGPRPCINGANREVVLASQQ